jgi:hypothetical protein
VASGIACPCGYAGMGLEIAKALLSAGATVGVPVRDPEQLSLPECRRDRCRVPTASVASPEDDGGRVRQVLPRRRRGDRQARERRQPRADQLTRRACPGALDRLTIAPTVRLRSFGTLPVAGTRRGDGERGGLGARQGTCASGRWVSLALHISRAEVDNAEQHCAELPSMRLREFSADGAYCLTRGKVTL